MKDISIRKMIELQADFVECQKHSGLVSLDRGYIQVDYQTLLKIAKQEHGEWVFGFFDFIIELTFDNQKLPHLLEEGEEVLFSAVVTKAQISGLIEETFEIRGE